MFDIGASELLVIAIVAILVIGPKDMPMALRTAGRWIGQVRRVSGHFRAGVDAMVREAEMEEMEKKWQERNARIMAENPEADFANEEMRPLPKKPEESEVAKPVAPGSAESRIATPKASDANEPGAPAPDPDSEPQLPLENDAKR